MLKRKKVVYRVAYFYCDKHLAAMDFFDRYSEALEYATEVSQDADNTEIYVTEIEITSTGLFKKKHWEEKDLLLLNEY